MDMMALNLIFLLNRNKWFIEQGDVWSPLENPDAIQLALTALPLVCVDEYDLTEQPLQNGYANVELESEDSVSIVIFSVDGSVKSRESMKLDAGLLSVVKWNEPPSNDGWLSPSVRLQVENVRRLSVKTYIPPMESSDGKDLMILNELTNEVRNVYIKRDQENEVLLIDEDSAGTHKLILSCEAEPDNEMNDVRSLGFVLVENSVDI